MTQEKLKEILVAHSLYLAGESIGARADLSRANLSWADLSGADLSGADLSGADLSGADLSGANLSRTYLSGADLSGANLSRTYLSGANLSGANLSGANLSGANLSRTYLSGANLSGADLSGANLSGAEGLTSAVDFLKSHFEKTEAGYIAYKTFNSQYHAPSTWKIEKGSVIEENVNSDRCKDCGCGINVAPIGWVRQHYYGAGNRAADDPRGRRACHRAAEYRSATGYAAKLWRGAIR